MRLLSWNIHGFVGRRGIFDVERVAKEIARINPALTALQEIELRPHGLDVLESVKKAAGEHMVSAPSMGEDHRWYGHGVFSRYPVIERHVHDLSVPGREPRRLIEAVIDTPSGPLRVLTTHLGLKRRERRHQFARIKEVFESGAGVPTALMGDLNEWMPAKGMCNRLMGNDSATSPCMQGTFPARLPILPLDRIMICPGALLSTCVIDRSAAEASDHLPLIADIDMQHLKKLNAQSA